MDIQGLHQLAITHFKHGNYEVVLNILRQAHFMRNESPIFAELDILCFISKVKVLEETTETIDFFFYLVQEIGPIAVRKIYDLGGAVIFKEFYQLVLKCFLDTEEEKIYEVSRYLWLASKDCDFLNDLKLQFILWMNLIEKHSQKVNIEEDNDLLKRPQINSSLKSLNSSIVKDVIGRWLIVAERDFNSLRYHESHSAFEIVEHLSCHLCGRGINFTENIYYAKIHKALLVKEIVDDDIYVSLDILNLSNLPVAFAENMRKKWYGQGLNLFQSKKYSYARFMLENYFLIGEHLQSPQFFSVVVNIATCYLKMNDVNRAVLKIKHVSSPNLVIVKDKNEAMNIKDLAKELFQNKHYDGALEFYKSAIEVLPNAEQIVKRDIRSNIALVYTKKEMWSDVLTHARECIDLDPYWHKGYYRLGYGQFKMKRFKNSMSTLEKGLHHCNGNEAIDLCILLFKARAKTGETKERFGRASQKILQSTLDELNKESTKDAFKALSNLIFTTKVGNSLDARKICLHNCIDLDAPYELFEYVVNSKSNVRDAKLLKRCMDCNMFKRSALLIVKGARLKMDSIKTTPLIYCIAQVINKQCDKRVLECMVKLEMVNISETDQYGNTALHICCRNEFIDVKLNIVELLLQHDIKINVRNNYGRIPTDLLRSNDLRLKVINNKVKKENQYVRQSTRLLEERPQKRVRQLHDEEKGYGFEKKDVYVPSLNGDGMKCYLDKDWSGAVLAFNKPIRKMRNKGGQERRNCEILVFSAISHLELSNENSGRAFELLRKACEISPTKGFVREALLHHYGEDIVSPIHSFILNYCIKEYGDLVTAKEGTDFLLSIITEKERNEQLNSIHNSLKVFHKEVDIKQFLTPLKSEQQYQLVLQDLAFAWFDCGKKLFEKEKPNQLAFEIVLGVLELFADDGHQSVRSQARLYIAVGLLREGASKEVLDMLKKAIEIDKNAVLELFQKWVEYIQLHLKNKKYRSTSFYVSNCVQLLGNKIVNNHFEKAGCQVVVHAYIKCLMETKEVDEKTQAALISALKFLKLEDQEMSNRLLYQANETKIKKLKTPMLSIALHVLPATETELKAEILYQLATKLMNTNKKLDALKYAEEYHRIRKTDYECFSLLAKIYGNLGKHTECMEILLEGIIVVDNPEKTPLLISELFIFRATINETSEIQLPEDKLSEIKSAVTVLKNEPNSPLFKALENMALYSHCDEEITKEIIQGLTVQSCLELKFSEEFLKIVVENQDLSIITNGDIESLLKMKFEDAASTYVIRKGDDKRTLDRPLVIALKLSLLYGNLRLLNKVIEKIPDEEIAAALNSCINICCQKDSKDNKERDALEILLIGSKRIKDRQVDKKILSKLGEKDARFKLIIDYLGSSNIKSESVKSNSDISMFENSETIHSDLCALVNNLSINVSQDENTFSEIKKTTENEDMKIESFGKVESNTKVDSQMKPMESPNDSGSEEDDVTDLENITFDDTWEIECTQDVYRVLRSKKLPKLTKKKIIQKIQVLASGEWPRDIQKPLEGVENGIRLYEAKIDKGSRIIWEISVSFSPRRSMEQDILQYYGRDESGEKGAVYEDKIRIWNIALEHDKVKAMIEKIVHSHERGKDCIIQKELKGIKQTLQQYKNEKHPNVYVNEEFVRDYMNQRSRQSEPIERVKYLFIPPASPNETEYNILKFYSFTSQVASRILSLKNSHCDFPFQVSPLEYAIIQLEPKHKCAILLLGRSGTGKTTCCLYRLWSKYQNYWKIAAYTGPQLPKFKVCVPVQDDIEDDAECDLVSPNTEEQDEKFSMEEKDQYLEEKIVDEDCEHFRQVLVTKNEVLCSEIKKNFKELCIGSQFQMYEEIEDIECKTFDDISPEHYPIFITTKDLILLLDSSLPGKKFFERDAENNELVHEIPGWGKNKVHLSYLPMDELSDEEDESSEELHNDILDDEVQSNISKDNSNRREVTYQVFETEIWPQLLKKKKIHCHPLLVWMEIKSFIKGSAESLAGTDNKGQLTGYLSLDEYLNVGKKRAPNFEGNREEIYELFLRYERLKSHSTFFDEMDVHFQLYKRLKEQVIPDWAFHDIYIDETQDFTQAELLLIMRCSANPNAMFFTGDTAQSIMSGVAFRFCDLQSLFLIAKREFESLKIPSPIAVPKRIHQLTHNYRSHAGILKLSSTLVQLIKLFFPASIDSAKPDIGLFPGPNPVIVDTDDFAELAVLLKGSSRQTSAIEFGAHQVVLVQNEECKKRLPAELSYGLVLSIYESKGLEFDDVLLYNFFKDSSAVEEWRVIASNTDSVNVEFETSEASMQILEDENLDINYRPLEFDYNKHKLLNSELKKLYTAITRARVNVWIFDEDKKKRAPMFDFLVKKDLVTVAKLKEGFTPESFAEKSSKADWNKQGNYFYGKNLFTLASKCANKAGNDVLVQKCDSKLEFIKALECAQGWKIRSNRGSIYNVYSKFKYCAFLFLKCGLIEDAKVSLFNAKEYNLYAIICEKQQNYSEAAKFFKYAKEKEDALRCFKLCGNIRSVIKLLKESQRYIEALEYDRSESSSEMEKNDLIDAALEHYRKEKSFEPLKKVLTYIDYSKQIDYLENKSDLQSVLEETYKSNNKGDDLARFYVRKKRFLEAAKLPTSDKQKVDLILKAFKEYSSKKSSMLKDELTDMIKYFLETSNQVDELKKIDLQYAYLYLTHDRNLLKDIFWQYDQCNDHIGKLLSILFLTDVEYNPSSSFCGIPDFYRKIDDLVKSVLRLVSYLADDSKANDWIKSTLNRFGYSMNRSGYAVDEVTIQYYLSIAKITLPPQSQSDGISFVAAKSTCCSILLGLIKTLIESLREFGYSLCDTKVVCGTKESCAVKHCAKIHQLPPTFDDVKTGCQSVFMLLSIGFYCDKTGETFKNSKLNTSSFDWLLDYSRVTDMYKIYALLQSYIPYLNFIGTGSFANLIRQKRDNCSAPLQLLRSLMEREWDKSVAEKTMDIKTYIRLSFLSYMIDKGKPYIDTLRASKREKYYPYNHLEKFNSSLSSLYFDRNIKSALNGLLGLVKRLPPSPGIFCDIMEVPIVLLFTSISATTPSDEKYFVFFPGSYVEQLSVWDDLYGGSSYKMAIGKLHRKRGNWEIFYGNMRELCHLLTTDESNMPFGHLISILKSVDESLKLLFNASRMICLYLVILSNLQGDLNDFGADFFSLFNKFTIEGDHMLISYFNKMKSVKNSDDAKNLLKQFLKERKDVLKRCTWSSKNVRLAFPTVISEYSETGTKTVSKMKILQRIENNEKPRSAHFDNTETDKSNAVITDTNNNVINVSNEWMKKENPDESQNIQKDATIPGYFDDEDLEEEDDPEVKKEMEARKKEKEEQSIAAAKDALSKKYFDQWNGIVRLKIKRRKLAEKRLNAGIKVLGFLRWAVRKNKTLEKLKDHEKYFENNNCDICNVKCESKRLHIQIPKHLENVEEYENHLLLKKEHEDAYNLYIELDTPITDFESLLMRFKTKMTLLTRKEKKKYPYNDELKDIVESMKDLVNSTEGNHRQTEDQLHKFQDIADSHKKVSTKNLRKRKT